MTTMEQAMMMAAASCDNAEWMRVFDNARIHNVQRLEDEARRHEEEEIRKEAEAIARMQAAIKKRRAENKMKDVYAWKVFHPGEYHMACGIMFADSENEVIAEVKKRFGKDVVPVFQHLDGSRSFCQIHEVW